jgi:hypothetical protein
MEETIAEKDVGVTINNKLSFDKHITESQQSQFYNRKFQDHMYHS